VFEGLGYVRFLAANLVADIHSTSVTYCNDLELKYNQFVSKLLQNLGFTRCSQTAGILSELC
jgi:hypothetical protein